MASFTVRRVGSGLSWSLEFTTRLRTLSMSFSSANRWRSSSTPRRSHSRSHFQEQSRSFRSRTPLQQQASAPPNMNSTPQSPPPRPVNLSTRASNPYEPSSQHSRSTTASAAVPSEALRELQHGLSDEPLAPTSGSNASATVPGDQVDWARSFHGLSTAPFSKEAADILLAPIAEDDIEIKPDGIIYLPEIKYRRILNRAFGPGAWGLAPRGETIITAKAVTREYALLVHGRLVSIARGEQDYFDTDGIPTATEGCKSNALMRCCKDLGVASELWDPRFVRKWLTSNAKEVWVEHQGTKKRKKITLRKDDQVRYPFKEAAAVPGVTNNARS